MGDKTKIEWATATWNPITGCTPVSAGCANCYARRMTRRFPERHLDGTGDYQRQLKENEPFDRIVFHPSRLDIPLHWKKPRRIFICSTGDLFHEDVPSSEICNVFRIVKRCPRHTFMVLTKRAERMEEFVKDYAEVFPNVWLGVTAENQEMADQRIPILLQTPAAKRFVSIEPMLGPVDLTNIPVPSVGRPWHMVNALNGTARSRTPTGGEFTNDQFGSLDWVICGPENGPGARPMDIEWPRSLLDQCRAAGVPFFMKTPKKQTLPPDLMVREFPNG